MTTVQARAKINLRHRVLERDGTGFHSVETLLLRTSLADEVGVEESASGIAVDVDGPESAGVPTDARNLCWRAAEAFLEAAFPRARARPGVRITLEKRIPAGTGLGGGSADAAAVLRLLQSRYGRLGDRELFGVAGEIGSDVPFGVLDVPMALGWERGRRLLPLRPPPTAPGLLVLPPIRVSTPEAYGWLAAARSGPAGGASILPGPTRLTEWNVLGRLVRNDLEPPVFARHPELSAARSELAATGPRIVGMTGSGSALFAIYEDDAARGRAAEAWRGSRGDGWGLREIRLPI